MPEDRPPAFAGSGTGCVGLDGATWCAKSNFPTWGVGEAFAKRRVLCEALSPILIGRGDCLGEPAGLSVGAQSSPIVFDGCSAQRRIAVVAAELHSGPMDGHLAPSTVNCLAIAARKDMKNVHLYHFA
jgi:hypothetical protein